MGKIDEVARLIRSSNKTIVFTGAGISTESGIPDFRSSKGFYASAPKDVFSKQFFHEKNKEFYRYFRRYFEMSKAEPNQGHRILAEWEKRNLVHLTVTQNTDNLHNKAGSKNVIRFHGDVTYSYCLNPKCKKQYVTGELLQERKETEDYYCHDCKRGNSKLIKPGIVLFGDDPVGFNKIQREVMNADVLIVLGTSLKVFPFASFVHSSPPFMPIIVINLEEIFIPNHYHVLQINDSIGKTLNAINEKL